MRAAVALLFAVSAAAQSPPIIDMHLHADTADANGPPPMAICPGQAFPPRDPANEWLQIFTAWAKNPPCKSPIWGPATDDAVMSRTLAILERRNIIAVTSGPLLDRWRKAGGPRIVPALAFGGPPASWPAPEEFRKRLQEGGYRAFAEVSIQYNGISPSDPEFEPYLAIAEELDVPMGIHIGTGPPGAPYFPPYKNYRARLHSALVLEEALLRHPKLRVWIMHAGWPMIDDLLAVMWAHPQVYAEVGVIDWVLPRAEFHRYLQRIVEAGFGKRVMFGSDQMNWPGAIEYAIESITSAPFLTAQQKHDILHDNAARFLRLGNDTR